MIKDFFIDKFEYDFRSNQKWCEVLQQNEDSLSPFILKSFSHIINVHHIWITRIEGKIAESHTWDQLPLDYWAKLCQDNHLKTNDYLEKIELNTKVNYMSEEGVRLEKIDIDILYHILNHSTYHRAQISREICDLGLSPPSFNFISFK